MSIVGERVTVAALWPEGYVTGVLSADLGDRLTGELEVGVFFWGETPESHIGDLRIAGSI
jgi:hypothetical protein